MRKEKGNSNCHNSGFGRPFQVIFVFNPRIFSISTQPNSRKAVRASRFFEKRLLLIEIWRKSKKEIQWGGMSFSNRSRKNTRNQKKNCAETTFESEVTIIWKNFLKIEGSREFRKFQTAITRASDVRFSRFFFWTCVFFRYLRNQTALRRFERADFSINAFCSFLGE